MPSYAVKTKHEEDLWEEAKEIVKEQYGEHIWPIVMTIYKNKKNKYPKSKKAALNATMYGPANRSTTKKRWEQHQQLINQGFSEDVVISKVLGHNLLGDISERVYSSWQKKQAARKLFWHGTSTKYLREILKKGLIPDPKELQYDKERSQGSAASIKTYGGSYLTSKLQTAMSYSSNAVRNKGGEELVLAVTFETKSNSVLLDEDYFMSYLKYATKARRGSDLFETSRGSSWGNLFYNDYQFREVDYFYPSTYRNAFLLIENTKLNNEIMQGMIKEFFSNVVEGYPKAANRIERQKENLAPIVSELVKNYAKHLLESLFHFKKKSTLLEWMEKTLLNRGQAEKYEEEKGILNQVENLYLKGTLGELVKSVNLVGKKIKEMAQETSVGGYQQNIRVLEPITFRGKNRILDVIQMKEIRLKDSNVFDVTFYKADPKVVSQFIGEFNQAQGHTTRFKARSGKVLSYHLSRYLVLEDVSEIESLWGISLNKLKSLANSNGDIFF